MYRKSDLSDNNKGLEIQIPWDPNTAKGFAISLLVLVALYFISPYIRMSPPPLIRTIETVPLTLLNFGSGDGTGLKSGNLTKEGAKAKGKDPIINIQDAEVSAADVKKANITSNTDQLADRINPVKELTSENKDDLLKKGKDKSNIGGKDGDLDGSGLKNTGSGKGAGDGFGDIDWGGGGNRIVLEKPLPKFPNSVKTSAQIKLRFKVLPDGTVMSVIPLQKADPELEAAAIAALKKWRFNPVKEEDGIMVGTIPLTFILR